MIRNDESKSLSQLIKVSSVVAACGLLVMFLGVIANAQTQRSKAKTVKAYAREVQRPLYREYRGVQLGMTTEAARAKLGEPALKGEDQDFYAFSEHETAQIAYNAAHQVVTISIDYIAGVGAPDYRTVVGVALEVRPDGSTYKMVFYEGERFWVSYNKNVGSVPTVTITLQQLR
jgi:uncharacterized protein YaiE (UPF0345 family)